MLSSKSVSFTWLQMLGIFFSTALIALVIDKPVILATWPSVSVILALQSTS